MTRPYQLAYMSSWTASDLFNVFPYQPAHPTSILRDSLVQRQIEQTSSMEIVREIISYLLITTNKVCLPQKLAYQETGNEIISAMCKNSCVALFCVGFLFSLKIFIHFKWFIETRAEMVHTYTPRLPIYFRQARVSMAIIYFEGTCMEWGQGIICLNRAPTESYQFVLSH